MAVIAFAGGFAVGRRSTPSTESTPTVPAAAPPAAVLPQRGEAAAVDPALTGRVSYVAAGGETRPDAGARVLVLPEERQGSTRLAADGLRSGAAEPDQRVALAAIRALGGDFCIAGEDGRYTIQLPQAGIYQVVIVSRYQSRGGDAAPAEALQFLSRYFDRPAQVLGDAAVHISQFRYRGSGTSPRDQTFELR